MLPDLCDDYSVKQNICGCMTFMFIAAILIQIYYKD